VRRKVSRRQFLRQAGAAAILAAGFPWKKIAAGAALDDTGLTFNCVAGDVTSTGALVWLRADKEGSVSIRYGKDPALKDFAATPPARVARESDFTAKIPLDSLEPASVYFYQAVVESKKPGPVGRLKTAPPSNDAVDFRFAFSGDTRQTYRPFSIMDSIRAMNPDFFLHLGDTIYADMDGKAYTQDQYWAKHRTNRSDQPSQNLFSETSVYALWDDHEIENNYNRLTPIFQIGRKAFFDYWPVRENSADRDRVYRSFRWGKTAEFFLLDVRQYRNRVPATILGEQQKRWFLEALGSSDAAFKFVTTPVPFSSPDPDKWGGFPEDRNEVLALIKKKKISGVVFLTADVHYAAVAHVPGALGLRELITGPLAAQMNTKISGTAKRFEFFKGDVFNYGLVNVYGKAASPYVEVELLGPKNEPLYKTKVEIS